MLTECDLEMLNLVENLSIPPFTAKMETAMWTRDYIECLPDDSFFHIGPGGRKDREGKTLPRSLRYAAYKDHLGAVHLPHLASAKWKIERIPNLNGKSRGELRQRVAEAWEQCGLKETAMTVTTEELLDLNYLAELLTAEEMLEEAAKWTAKRVNDMPDRCFVLIEPGGEKDAEGKTTPRRLRHLPVYDEGGKIDLPHLRNARARVNKLKVSDELKKKAMRKLDALAKKYLKDAEPLLSEGELDFLLTGLAEEDGFEAETEFSILERAEGPLFAGPEFDRYRGRKDLMFFTCRLAVADSRDKVGRVIEAGELAAAAESLVGQPVNMRHFRKSPMGAVVGQRLEDSALYAAGVLWADVFPELTMLKEARERLAVSWELRAADRDYDEQADVLKLKGIRFVGMAICPKSTAAVPEAEILELASDEEAVMKELIDRLSAAQTEKAELKTRLEATERERDGLKTEIEALKTQVEEAENAKAAAVAEALASERTKAEKITARTAELKAVYSEAAMPEKLEDLVDDAKFELLKLAAERDKFKAEAERAKTTETATISAPAGGTPAATAQTKRGLDDYRV